MIDIENRVVYSQPKLDRHCTAGISKPKRSSVVSGIDKAAVIIVLLAACLSVGIMGIVAALNFAQFITNSWANPTERWLLIILGMAIIWVVFRWKKLAAS
jgi:hypothetical protein